MPMKKLKRYMFNTEDERRASLSGLNLFFGALLGANLGTIGDLATKDYVSIIVHLAAFVASLFFLLNSRRKVMIAIYLISILLMLGALYLSPLYRPVGAEQVIDRIVVTLMVWVAFAGAIRFTPVVEDEDPAPRRPMSVLEDEA